MSEPRQEVQSTSTDADRQRRDVLADAIVARIDDIERRWLERVEQELAARRRDIAPTDLRDAVRDYLARLADALRGEHPVERGGRAAWEQVAREHAITRARLGFDIDQLVREFILLRRVLLDVAREEKVIADDYHSERLVDLIGAAIAMSIRSYVESRDVAERRHQAEHIAFLTHELRNPLSTATMAASRLRKRRPELVAAEQGTVDMLDRGLSRMRSLIDGIVLTQRLDAQEIECRPVEVSLGQIMPAATRSAELEAKNKGVGFVAQYDAAVQVHADPGLAVAALQNVVDNAVKLTARGRVQVVAEARDAEIVVHVYDDREAGAPPDTDKVATGVGPAIARRAIEAQGGRIGADWGGERGCHLWLTLPRPLH